MEHAASIDHRAYVKNRDAAICKGSFPSMAPAAAPPTRHGRSRFSFPNGWLSGHFIGSVLHVRALYRYSIYLLIVIMAAIFVVDSLVDALKPNPHKHTTRPRNLDLATPIPRSRHHRISSANLAFHSTSGQYRCYSPEPQLQASSTTSQPTTSALHSHPETSSSPKSPSSPLSFSA